MSEKTPQHGNGPAGGNDLTTEEQGRIGGDFLRGLLQEMGTTATVTSSELASGVIELSVTGEDLGTLIGPKGATLAALQELTRTVLQREASFSERRVIVDVNAYRRRRHEALTRFVQQVAAEVKQNQTRRALEPMPPADRKVVHDAVNAIDGVTTVSQGEEPYRRVVLVPVPIGTSPAHQAGELDEAAQDDAEVATS